MAVLSGWPSITDDSGTGQDGTVYDKAFFDAILASIEGELVSATNPSETVKGIIDEVVDARGSKATLDTRLDVSLNDDGTLKTQASLASLANLQAQIGANNLIQNDDFVVWASGDAVAPTGWSLSTITAARAGTGLGDATRKIGDFCVKLTRAGSDGYLAQAIVKSAEMTRCDFLKSKILSMGAWVKSSTPNAARIAITDGATTTFSSYHTGGGSWEWLTVEHTVSNSATAIDAWLSVYNTASDAYFDGVTLVMSDKAPTQWQPCPKVYGTLAWRNSGTASVADGKDYFPFGRLGIVKDVQLYAPTGPVGADLIVDVEQYDGSSWQTMFSTQPEIADGANDGNAQPDGTYAYRCFGGGDSDLATGDNVIRWNIDQVGSGTEGEDVYCLVRTLQYARPLESLLEHDSY